MAPRRASRDTAPELPEIDEVAGAIDEHALDDPDLELIHQLAPHPAPQEPDT